MKIVRKWQLQVSIFKYMLRLREKKRGKEKIRTVPKLLAWVFWLTIHQERIIERTSLRAKGQFRIWPF